MSVLKGKTLPWLWILRHITIQRLVIYLIRSLDQCSLVADLLKEIQVMLIVLAVFVVAPSFQLYTPSYQ